MCSSAKALSPASSSISRISSSSKAPTSAAYNASTPIASPPTINGMTASELTPRSSSSFLISLCGSFLTSFEIIGFMSLTARPARPCPPRLFSTTVKGAASKKPRTSPAEATGFTIFASRSANPPLTDPLLVPDPRLPFSVANAQRPPLSHRYRADAMAFGRCIAQRKIALDHLQKPFVSPRRGDRLQAHLLLIHDAQPGESKTSGIDRNATGLLEQLAAVPDARDDPVNTTEHRAHAG